MFRNRLIASIISNTGGWMQDTAGTWLMTSLTTSPLLIALMQTAASLPVTLLGLPAGATADIFDRRRLLIGWSWWMLAIAAVLAVLTLFGWINPAVLLVLTFLLSVGTAMNAPTWQAIVPELVPRDELPDAVAINSAGFNLARAIGPAAGGLMVAAFASVYAGAGMVFAINAVSFIAVLIVTYLWQRKPMFTSTLPAERMIGSMRAGLRYIRFGPGLRGILIRAFLQTFGVSAMWALLAVVADQYLHKGAMGYGILNGCIGAGAVIGALVVPRIRHLLSADATVNLAGGVFVIALIVMAYWHTWPPLIIALTAAGVAWTATTSSLNVAVQLSVPAWVQARSLGTYQMVFQGGMALGSVVWGVVAEHANTKIALTSAAFLLAASLPISRGFKLMSGAGRDYSPGKLRLALNRAEPQLMLDLKPDDGPVRVNLKFVIQAEQADDFIRAMHDLGTIRRRDGAIRWGLWHDPYDPTHFTESFVVESWLEHLRMLERFTQADHAIRDAAFSFHQGPPPVAERLILARAERKATPGRT